MRSCGCSEAHPTKLIALTGGPGAGKTAVLELVRHHLCEHLVVLPEAATIVFGGGFPRREGLSPRRAAQRAIAHVQLELERMELDAIAHGERGGATILCDRGVVDGVAYWPNGDEDFWRNLGTTRAALLARYAAVIHLRTPRPEQYNHQNRVRTESAVEAARIDERIAAAWEGHPRRFFVDSETDFMVKAARALSILSAEMPACCRIAVRDAAVGDGLRA